MPGPGRQGPGGPGRGPRPRGMRSEVQNPGRVLKRLLGYVAVNYRFHMIGILVLIVISVLANVQGTLFTRTLIDSYIVPLLQADTPDFGPLLAAILRVACFYAIGAFSAFLWNRLNIYVTQGTLREHTPAAEGVLFEPYLCRLGGMLYEEK